MNRFKAGDRVICYDRYQPNSKGIVLGSTTPQYLDIKLDDGTTDLVHYKTCRKLVKKPKRTFWINVYDKTPDSPLYGSLHSSKEKADRTTSPVLKRIECLKVREVTRKKDKK